MDVGIVDNDSLQSISAVGFADSSGKKGPMLVLEGIPGVGVAAEIADQTTTPTQTDFASGLLSVTIDYIDRGSAVGTVLYVVFDALDDADASTKLGAAGSREVIMLGGSKPYTFLPSSPCYRIDVASDAASETGDSLVFMSGKVPA